MREGTFSNLQVDDSWLEWLGALLIRNDGFDELGLLADAPWHAERYLIGEKVMIDFSSTGGPKMLCEIVGRRPHGDRLDLSIARVPTEHPLA